MTESVAPACSEDGLPDPLPMTAEYLAQIAKALGHPARIHILEQFDECIPHLAGEVVENCELAQSTVSEHLRILREADVLFSRKDGPKTWYCVRRSVLHAFARAMDDLAVMPVLDHHAP
ncbi:MAG: helix-turn-helix transcriptional regulator [Acidimicrobiia bacterium]|nr:helix-turn-helix transcriptional regulator [Acidimicrobiia bacterium]